MSDERGSIRDEEREREAVKEKERNGNGLILINNQAIIMWKKCNHTRYPLNHVLASAVHTHAQLTHSLCPTVWDGSLNGFNTLRLNSFQFFWNSLGYIVLILRFWVLLLFNPPHDRRPFASNFEHTIKICEHHQAFVWEWKRWRVKKIPGQMRAYY